MDQGVHRFVKKIQFGAGSLHIEGWENHDMDVDVTQPLPYPDNSVDFIFSDQMLEHVTPRQAWSYLEECHRILRPGGVVRTTIPDFSRLLRLRNPEWMRVNRAVTGNDGSLREQMKSVVFCHSHQGLWSAELLADVKSAIGFFPVRIHEAGRSQHPDLQNVEQHYRSVGVEVATAEAGCVEGTK